MIISIVLTILNQLGERAQHWGTLWSKLKPRGMDIAVFMTIMTAATSS